MSSIRVGARYLEPAAPPATASELNLSDELALIEPAGPLCYLDVQVADQLKATSADCDGLTPGAR